MEVSEGTIAAISVLQPIWLQQVKLSYENDVECQQLISHIVLDSQGLPYFEYVQGILKKKEEYMLAVVDSHSGQTACLQTIKLAFCWPKMKADVIEEIRSCVVCQRSKSEHVQYPGLLQPLAVPTQPWKDISIDFVEQLPLSEGMDTVLVVVDIFSKYGHFIALKHPFSAKEVAYIFLDNIFRLQGMPSSIVSDRDRIFTSVFWSTLFGELGVNLHFSIAYHPQSDGQTERLNQCLESYLRCFTSERPNSWRKWLPMAEFCYNTSFHTSLGITPYEVVYGVKPVPLSMGNIQDMLIPAAQDTLQQRTQVVQVLRVNLNKAQQRMKYFADLKRTDRTLEVGDWVYLKLQPYKQ